MLDRYSNWAWINCLDCFVKKKLGSHKLQSMTQYLLQDTTASTSHVFHLLLSVTNAAKRMANLSVTTILRPYQTKI